MNTKSPGPQIHEIDWLTPSTREILSLAQQEAAQTGRPLIQPEYLLLGVLLQGKSKAATLLNTCGLDVETLRAQMQRTSSAEYLSSTEPSPPLSQAAQECIERAIAMIAYYLTRNRSLAKVAPEHLVLRALSLILVSKNSSSPIPRR